MYHYASTVKKRAHMHTLGSYLKGITKLPSIPFLSLVGT